MMFENPELPVSILEIQNIEAATGLTFPQDLIDSYLAFNGGNPIPYVYEDENIDTVISEFLPLVSPSGRRTACEVYNHLVTEKCIVDSHFFPILVDGGGDYFFVDCKSENGTVHFYRSDPFDSEPALSSLNIGIREFWSRLKEE